MDSETEDESCCCSYVIEASSSFILISTGDDIDGYTDITACPVFNGITSYVALPFVLSVV